MICTIFDVADSVFRESSMRRKRFTALGCMIILPKLRQAGDRCANICCIWVEILCNTLKVRNKNVSLIQACNTTIHYNSVPERYKLILCHSQATNRGVSINSDSFFTFKKKPLVYLVSPIAPPPPPSNSRWLHKVRATAFMVVHHYAIAWPELKVNEGTIFSAPLTKILFAISYQLLFSVYTSIIYLVVQTPVNTNLL